MNEKMIFLHPRGFQCNNGMHFIEINFFSLHPPWRPTVMARTLQVLDHHLLSGNGLPAHPAGREASLVEYPVNLKHPSYSSGFLKFSSWTCPATLFLSLTPLSSPIQLVMWMRHSMVVLCILNAEPMDHQGDALAHIEPGPGALQSLPQQHHKPQHNQVPIEC